MCFREFKLKKSLHFIISLSRFLCKTKVKNQHCCLDKTSYLQQITLLGKEKTFRIFNVPVSQVLKTSKLCTNECKTLKMEIRGLALRMFVVLRSDFCCTIFSLFHGQTVFSRATRGLNHMVQVGEGGVRSPAQGPSLVQGGDPQRVVVTTPTKPLK